MRESESTAQRAAAVLVTGAGRSGTSAITRGILALGVELGDRLRPPGGKNPTGFFEDQDILALNKRLKRQLGIRGDSLRLIEAQEWSTAGVRALHDEAVATIRRRFGAVPLWGFKYARTLRMLPFWEGVFSDLDMDLRYVIALRNPLSVARSRAQINPQRGRPVWSNLEWLVNVVPYFHQLRQHRFSVVDFDALMDDPAGQMRRVATALAVPLSDAVQVRIDSYAEEFLRPGMRHSRFHLDELMRDPRSFGLLCDAYAWLYRLAHDQVDCKDETLWRDWQRIRTEMVGLSPILEEMDYLRAQLGRAQWNPVSQWSAMRQLWRDWRSH